MCTMFTSYITMQLQYIAAFGGLHAYLQQIKVVVLPRWRQHGRELIFVVSSRRAALIHFIPSPASSALNPLPVLSLPLSAPAVCDTTVPSWYMLLASQPTATVTAPAGPAALPFCLASCLPPVPAKLVRYIQALEFIEMRELVPDNMALAERLEALPLRLGHPTKQAFQREVGSLITWVSSFTTYMAIVAEAHPVRDMLAYMRLIIREAHKHGGQDWLTYDAVFRCNHQGASQPWNVLDPCLRKRDTPPASHLPRHEPVLYYAH